MYDLIILGGGPAGMAAAIYAMRAKLNTLLIEQGAMGGQVLSTYEVDNYLGMPGMSGSDISERFREHADRLGVSFLTADVESIEDFGEKNHKISSFGARCSLCGTARLRFRDAAHLWSQLHGG